MVTGATELPELSYAVQRELYLSLKRRACSPGMLPEHAPDGTGLLRMPHGEARAPKASSIYVPTMSYKSLTFAYMLVSYLSYIQLSPRGGIRELSPCRDERGLPHEGLLVARAAHRYGREG